MRNSNKVLLIAVAVLLAFIISFVLVMGIAARDLFEQHGRTARAGSYRLEACNTMDLSLSSTPLFGSCNRASSSTARASS
jgi:hypothetical protein